MKTKEQITQEILSSTIANRERILALRKQKLNELEKQNNEYIELVKEYDILLERAFCRNAFDFETVKKDRETINKKLSFFTEQVERELPFFCPICNDTGYHNGIHCDCINKKANAEYLRINKNALPEYSFETLLPLIENIKQKETLSSVYTNFKIYAEKFPNVKRQNILLSGPSGSGKTGAVISLVNELKNKGITCLFVTAFELNQIFLKYHVAKVYDKATIFEPLLDCDFLVIDDLGSEPIIKGITEEYLKSLLDTRSAGGKGICVTTNIPIVPLENDCLTLLDRYGERVFSRLCNKRNTYIVSFTDATNLRII